MAVRGIKERPASRSFQSHYSSLTSFMTSVVEWAMKLRDKGMISSTTFGLATNAAAFVPVENKVIQMLEDLGRYIKSSNPDLFWELVHMISEKEQTQHGGGGRLAQSLAAAYKSYGGGDEIDSALAAPNDEHDAPRRFVSHQAPSNGPHHIEPIQRSQTEPVLVFPVPVEESKHGAQDGLVSPSASSVDSGHDSLPIAEEEQGYGSLQARAVSEGDPIQEEPEEGPQHPLPPEGGAPSASPSIPLQVGRPERDGTAEIGVRQRGGGGATDGRRETPSVQQSPFQPTPRPTHHTRKEDATNFNWSAMWQQYKNPLLTVLIVIFLVLCGLIFFGAYVVGKNEAGGLRRGGVQPCPNVRLDYTQSQPLMRILEEEVVSHFSEHWHQVGTQLELPTAKLTELEKDNPTNVKARLREVIKYWLKGNGRKPHTLGTLARAFEVSQCPKAAQDLLTHPELCEDHRATEQ